MIRPRILTLTFLAASCFLTACPETVVQSDAPSEPQASAEPTPSPEPETSATPAPTVSATPNPSESALTITPAPTSNPGAQGEATVQLPDGSRLVVSLPNRFLDQKGQSVQLNIRLVDASGNNIDLGSNRVVFSSSRPQDFSITDEGLIVALQDNGFSRITARIDGTDIEATQLISIASTVVGGTSSSGGGFNNVAATPTPSPSANLNVNVVLEGTQTRQEPN